MKITEIDWTDGKKYEVNITGVKRVYKVENRNLLLNDEDERSDLVDMIALQDILELDFTEIIDWSKVEVDTPIYIRNDSGGGMDTETFSQLLNRE